MDGVLIDLLKTKWNTFVKRRFYSQFFLFAFYFLISLICFTLRPGPPDKIAIQPGSNSTNATAIPMNITTNTPFESPLLNNTNPSESSEENVESSINVRKNKTAKNMKLRDWKSNCSEAHSNNNSTSNDSSSPCQKLRSGSGSSNKDYYPKKVDGDNDNDVEEWWDDLTEECRLMQINSHQAKVIKVFEFNTLFFFLITFFLNIDQDIS